MFRKLFGLLSVVALLCGVVGSTYAATLDKTAATVVPWSGVDKCYVMYNDVDLTGVATADVVQCLDIPAKTFVWDVFVEVITPTGLTSTATVGDGDGANSWDAEIDLNAAAATVTHGASGTDAYATSGKYYSATDTIDLTCTITSGPCTTGKVRVFAICATMK